MSIPQLNLFASGRPQPSDYQYIVPRTPHSRSGRAEEAITDPDVDDDDAASYATYRQQQAEPLLVSSASATFPSVGYRSRGDDHDDSSKKTSWRKNLNARLLFYNAPLILGTVVAGILLSLIVVSFKKPGKMDELVGYVATESALDRLQEDLAETPLPTPLSYHTPTPTFVDSMPPPGHLISYENYTAFPLTGAQYAHECNKMMGGKFMHHSAYWTPSAHGVMDVKHHDDVTDYHLPEGEQTRVCSKTITYQLDGHVGLAADLALMAQAAALARERNRTFLVDDTHWNRGKWVDHFQDVRSRQPGPEPGCRAPPPEELVACPRHSRHWVINSRTAKYHLGDEYSEEYEDPYKQSLNRQQPIFERSLQSFRDTIRPNAHNAELIRSARSELASILSLPVHSPTARNDDIYPSQAIDAEAILTQHNADPYIAVHIRRGDRHASNFPYRGKYVPLENFVSAAHSAWDRLYGEDPHAAAVRRDPTHFPAPPIAYVASDSHAAAEEFMSGFPSSSAVFSLDSSTDPALRALAPQHEYVQQEFDELPEQDRVRLTRGMVVDLAMLSGLWAWEGDVVPGATICTLSSNVCRIAAIGLGWDRAFGFGDGEDHTSGYINDEKKRWIDLDNRGIVSPSWTAFEVFT